MATIVNNPPQSNSSSGITSVVIALIVLFVLVYLGLVSMGYPQFKI